MIEQAVASVSPLDGAAMEAARRRQDTLTKPPGSLGRLEDLAVHLAGIRGVDAVPLGPAAVVVCAGDHGVVAEGVSAYPAAVTPQMVANFLAGGAAINVLARHAGARVVVIDAGVAADMPSHPDLIPGGIRTGGTGNIAREAAMTRDQARAAVELGISVAARLADEGIEAVCAGDMGIGNTTAASAVVSALCGVPAADVVGRGTGVDDDGLARKVAAVDAAVRRAGADPRDSLGVLAELGGLDIAAIAGVVVGAASRRMLCVLDGHPSTAGALAAAAMAPGVVDYCVAGHRSVEPGHGVALTALGLVPLLDLRLRLGEGTGAVLALTLVQAAARVAAEMATFDSAGVSGREEAAAGEPSAAG